MRPALGPVCRQRRGDAVVAPEHRREGPGVGERREPPAPSWGSCRGPRRRAGRRPRRGRDRGGRPAAADVAVARRQEVVTRSSRWSCSPAKGRARSRTRRRPRSWPRRCRARGSTRTRSSGPARSGGCRGSGGCCGNAGRAPRRRAARGRRRRPTGRRRDRPGRGEQARSRGGRPTLPVGPDDEVEGAVARGVGAHHHPAVVRAHGGHRHAGCTNPGSACPLDITGSLDLDGGHARDQDRGRLRRGRVELPGRAAAGSWCRGPGSTAYQIPSTAGTAPNFVAPTAAVTVPAAGRFSQLSLLASVRNGDARDVPATLLYADGDVSTRVSTSDWAAGSPRFGETDLVRTTGRVAMNSAPGTDGLPVHLWGATVATDPARTLVSVTFGPSAQLAVMSISGRHA